MKNQKQYVPVILVGLCLSLGFANEVCGGNEYGLPGEEFSSVRFPLEQSWIVESNPACLALEEGKRVGASVVPGFESSLWSSVYFFGPIKRDEDASGMLKGSTGIGFFLHNVSAGDLVGRGPNAEPLGNFSFSKTRITASYGQTVVPRLSAGISVKFAYYSTSKIENANLSGISKTAFGTDIGICYQPTPSANLALSICNFPFRPDVTLDARKEEWPLTVHVDAQMVLQERRLLLTAGMDYLRNDQGDGRDIQRIEGGVNYTIHSNLTVGLGYGNNEALGGIRITYHNLGIQYSISSADLGLLHYIGISYGFGARSGA